VDWGRINQTERVAERARKMKKREGLFSGGKVGKRIPTDKEGVSSTTKRDAWKKDTKTRELERS